MTDKELKKLNRGELLELLLEQSKYAEGLEAEVASLKSKLESRELNLSQAGSIAEAAMKLNHVFEDAQAAAEQYLENIQTLSGRQTEVCSRLEAESRAKAERMIAEAEQKCVALEAQTQEKCDRMLKKAEEESQAYWDRVSANVRQLMDQTAGLREFLTAGRNL